MCSRYKIDIDIDILAIVQSVKFYSMIHTLIQINNV